MTEAIVQRCSVKKVFLEISQNSQENTCARVSFLIKLQPSGPKKDVEKFSLFRADTVKILVTIEKLLILHLVAFMPGLSKWLDY